MNLSRAVWIWLVLLLPRILLAQEEKKLFLDGYIKDMVTFNILGEEAEDRLLVDNLIHNRLNFKWYPTDNLSGFLEIRNRFFHGDLVKTIPNYSDFIDVNNDFFDLSVNVVDNGNVLLHSMIDRLFIQWNKDNWEVKAGRQRINWGTNLVWNPNDLFNAYSFFDFDYEERPGSDAIRIQRYTGFASSIEVAFKIADRFEDFVGAAMWKVNKGGYDLQFITGVANEDLTLGFGWAGNIKTSGFKGEMTYFQPFEVTEEQFRAYVASITWDYSFRNSLYVMFSTLYNSAGSYDPPQQDIIASTRFTLTAKELSPYRFSLITQGSYPVHPLVNLGMAIMTFPGGKSMFVYPTVSWSVIENFDFDLFGQFFWDDPNGEFESTGKAVFARVKWSF